MDFNIEVRRKQLDSLDQFISSSKDKVQSILDCLRWSAETALEVKQYITCSVDPSHRVPPSSVDRHIKKCCMRKEGYDLKEQFLSDPLHDTQSSILIDDHKKIEILIKSHRSVPDFKSGWNGQDPDPKTSDRLLCTFSPDERLALYEYGVASTVGPSKVPEFNIVQPKNLAERPLTDEEILARERDLKRRRIKYKSVHTSRKSHTEVMREVIDGQMELYKYWLNDDNILQQSDNDIHENKDTPISKVEPARSEPRDSKRPPTPVPDRSESLYSRSSNYSGSSKGKKYDKTLHNHNHERYDKKFRRSREYSNDRSEHYNGTVRDCNRRSRDRESSHSHQSRRRSRDRGYGNYRSRRKHSRHVSRNRYYSERRRSKDRHSDKDHYSYSDRHFDR